jgi:hypothetical protein
MDIPPDWTASIDRARHCSGETTKARRARLRHGPDTGRTKVTRPIMFTPLFAEQVIP